ncbi:MBL fold metallo-hydrolase, partial [Streptomyces sp. DT225]
ELTRTKVRALDPELRLGDEGLGTGDVITTGGLEMYVVPTPGHTADSLSFHLPADQAVLTGDTILGRGTTLVAHPDGRLGDYLDSLRRLRSLTVDDGVHTVLPGHGPVLDDAQGAVEFYLAHRAHRLAQVETAVESGYRTSSEVVAHVYADVDRSLWPAAELSVRAQLDYLAEHGLSGG